jgi:hypothetical protein
MIDIGYDFRVDINFNGSDVDKYSHTLRQYHKILWSKQLPDGRFLSLDDRKENVYLFAQIDSQEFFLSSDSFSHTYSRWKRTQHIIEQIPSNEIEEFLNIAYTIGGYIIFPSNKVNQLPSINQERGTNNFICDRFDLTLECIRRYYNNEKSPLFDTLKRYDNFFKLFTNFKGYCEHFLLQDLVDDTFTEVRFVLPFEDFIYGPYPRTVDEYYIYKNNVMDFNKNRNIRIDKVTKNGIYPVSIKI